MCQSHHHKASLSVPNRTLFSISSWLRAFGMITVLILLWSAIYWANALP